jgi:predicted ATPase
LHGLRAIFVGRQAELLALEKLSQNLFLGKGGLAWVEGDPGIGKSRLTREFEARITEEHSRRVQDSTHPPLILRGTCTARRSDFAFSVFSDLLSSALDIQSNFTPSDIYRQVEESLREWPQELKETRPFLEMLVGVQPSGALGEQLVALEPEQLRRQTFVAINRLCSWMADRRPLILILDDVQWIDAISADLLLYLTPLAISHPLLFICAQRLNEPSDHEKTLAQVRKLFGQSSLHLQLLPLSIDECHSLLSQFLSRDGGSGLDQAILSLIVQQSGGNPYFIEEFVRMLVEQDYLRVARGGLEVNQTLQVDTLRIPSSLETLIRARVDSLPTSARELLQVASIIGHRFASDLLAEIAQRRQIGSYLEVLHTRGMLARISAPLAEISSGRSTPASSRSEPLVEAAEVGHWEFSHPMIEGVVYNTVLKAQRRILHHRTALALETHWRGVESEHAEDLAYHFAKAEQYTPALGYLILAGERAAARHANDAAVAYFEQASDMLSAVPQASAENRWRIICGLGEVYQFTGNYAASLSTLQTGAELLKNTVLTSAQFASLYRLMGDTYQKKGDLDQAIHNLQVAIEMVGHGRIDLHDPASEAEAARIYARLGWSYFIKADFDNARDAVLKAENLARNANNLNALAAAENLLGGIHYRKGDLLQAVHHTRQAMTYWQELGYSWGVAVTLSNLGILEVTAGDWKSAADSFRRALRLRQEMGDVEGVAIAHNNLGHLGLDQGKLQEAETSFRSSLEISGPFQMTYHKATSYQGLAQALLDQASLLARNSPKRQKWITEAEEVIQTGSRLAQEIEARELQAEMQRVASRITLEQGQIEHAEQQGREAITLAMEIGSSMPESGARRAVAEALLRRGQAEQALQTILEVWERLSPNVDELETGRVHAQLAKIYQALQNPVKTELHRNTARQIFERLGAAHDLLLLGVGELTG